MNPSQKLLVSRVDELIAQADSVVATKFFHKARNSAGAFVDGPKLGACRAASLSFVRSTFGSDHPYFRDIDAGVTGNQLAAAMFLREILGAIRQEISGGWLGGLRHRVSAEMLADFMEMAHDLNGQGYFTASAVLVGCSLEEHLRELCRTRDLPIEREVDGRLVPMKADRLNADLAKAGVYNHLDAKSVGAWLDLRNKAAHGKVADFSAGHVSGMYQGVADFLARTAPCAAR